MRKKMTITLITGSILGIICVVGATLRTSGELSLGYLFAFWFNRFLMGFVFGLLTYTADLKTLLIRGFGIGLLISFAFYSATSFEDLIGFIVGGVYGVIIVYVVYKFSE